MKSFKVIALSGDGSEAIAKNYSERKRMNPLESLLFKKTFNVIIPDDYSFIEFRGKSRAVDFIDGASMVKTLVCSMISEGCVEGKDFKVEISEVGLNG